MISLGGILLLLFLLHPYATAGYPDLFLSSPASGAIWELECHMPVGHDDATGPMVLLIPFPSEITLKGIPEPSFSVTDFFIESFWQPPEIG